MDRIEKIREWHDDHGEQIEKWLEELAKAEIHQLHTHHVKEMDIITAHCDLHNLVCDFLEIREKYDDKDDDSTSDNPRRRRRM